MQIKFGGRQIFIVRSEKTLNEANDKLDKLVYRISEFDCDTIKKCEVLNMLLVSKEIIEFAYNRKESLGSHNIENQ